MNVSMRFICWVLFTLAANTVLMVLFAFKYLHAVNMPQPRCLYPAAVPTMIPLVPRAVVRPHGVPPASA